MRACVPACLRACAQLKLAKWCEEPFFADAIRGSFVRYCIGKHPTKGSIYRVCEIVDVVAGRMESRMYKIGNEVLPSVPPRDFSTP